MTWQYIAGFFDGEGCITPRSKGRFGYAVNMAQSVKQGEVLFRIRDFMLAQGVRSTVYSGSEAGHKTPTYYLCINNQPSILLFLQSVRPHLIVKAKRADLAIAYAGGVVSKFAQRKANIAEGVRLYKEGFGVGRAAKIAKVDCKRLAKHLRSLGIASRPKGTNQFTYKQ